MDNFWNKLMDELKLHQQVYSGFVLNFEQALND